MTQKHRTYDYTMQTEYNSHEVLNDVSDKQNHEQ